LCASQLARRILASAIGRLLPADKALAIAEAATGRAPSRDSDDRKKQLSWLRFVPNGRDGNFGSVKCSARVWPKRNIKSKFAR
jgi:hypothetical protein